MSKNLNHNAADGVTQKQTSSTAEIIDPTEEYGGPKGPEPTRYGDWQVKGRVSDF